MNRSITTICLVAIMAFSWATLPGASHAQSLLLPEGLSPGDQYRVLFITEGSRDATSTDISNYNDFVNDEANRTGSVLSGLATTFSVVGSTPTVSAADNILLTPAADNDLPIFTSDGILFALNTADLFDNDFGLGTPSMYVLPVYLDQFSSTSTSAFYTGSNRDGTAAVNMLGDVSGLSNIGVAEVLAAALQPTGSSLPFIGISSPLTAVPEPTLAGDVNLDGVVNFLDISPFISILSTGGFQAEADIDQNEVVNFLDISPFIEILSSN